MGEGAGAVVADKSTQAYARLWGRTVGENSLRAALPGLFAVLLAAVIVFPGSGLRADYVTSHSLRTGPLRFALAVGWGLLTMPAARVLVSDPQVHWFRSLPLSPWQLMAPVAVATVALHSPWWILWWRGESFALASSALAVVAGGQCQWLLGLRSWRRASVWLVLVGGWGLVSSAVAQAGLAVVALVAFRRAFGAATDGPPPSMGLVVGKRRWSALCCALIAAGIRSNGSALLRLSSLMAMGVACLALGLSNNPHWAPEDRLRWVGAGWIGVWSAGALVLARPLCVADRQLQWVLSVTGVSLRLRRACVLGIVALAGGVLGAGFGATLTLGLTQPIAPFRGAPLPLVLAAAGSGLGGAAAVTARWALQTTGRDALRWLLGWLVLCGSSLYAWFGQWF